MSKRTLSLVLLAFAVRAYQLHTPTLAWDEGWSVALSQLPLGDLFNITAFDVHPPGYYLLLRAWLTLGRINAALSWNKSTESSTTVFAMYLVGAELLDKSLEPVVKNYARINSQAAANIPIVDGQSGHRLADDRVASFTDEIAYLVCGNQPVELLKSVLTRKIPADAAPLPAVYLEANTATAMQGIKKFVDLHPAIDAWLKSNPLEGRLQFTIARGDHEVTARFRIDEPALRSLAGPAVKKYFEFVSRLLKKAAQSIFTSSDKEDSELDPADAFAPSNR